MGSPRFPYEFVVYPATESGARGPELARETSTAERWAVHVEPGCYAVSIRSVGGPQSGWEDPIANQPAFCLVAGQTEVFETGGTLPNSPSRAIINGEVVDPAGNPLAGVTVEFFAPPDGLGPNEIRLLDHDTADHRGPFQFSQATDETGLYRYNNVSARCYIQTFTAPLGFTWPGGERTMTRSACSSEFRVLTAYPDSGPSPDHGWIEIEVPEVGANRLTGAIAFDGGGDRRAPYWFRASEHPFEGRFEVPPGCYLVRFDLAAGSLIWTATGRAFQEVPVCVGSGQSVAVAPVGGSREVAYDLTQPFLVSGFTLTDAVTPVPEVQLDLFYPVEGITDDELRSVDHGAADYRGPFYGSATAGVDGTSIVPVYGRCFVATMIAPDGFEFVDAGQYLQKTVCQGDDSLTSVLRPTGVRPAEFGGQVVDPAGVGVPDVAIDVFRPSPGVSDEVLRSADHTAVDYRGPYVTTVRTGSDGRFDFRFDPGCVVLTYIGPDDASLPTGRYLRQTLCPGDSPVVVVGSGPAVGGTISGTVVGGPAVTVDLFEANADGTRGPWLGDARTVDGAYSFDVPAGCYVTVLIAPPGYTFGPSGTVPGAIWQRMSACVDDGVMAANQPATLVAG